MLERFCEQKKLLHYIALARQMLRIQWKLAEMLISILKQFETSTREMSADDACTSQIIPFMYAMEKFIDYACNNVEGIQKVVNDLHVDFNRRFQKYRYNNHSKI